ncbi:DUF58 domain-containing protein [Thiomonas sp. FB-Cd]|uniref:DUF58 domain-containing protein n=1 Tax=Thiomonas sp. FB-Cd TaxID=1158292 RepID=UPI0006916819|nr:DUF58 domain-containing protein [Thiomonas sp. FB-Cd]
MHGRPLNLRKALGTLRDILGQPSVPASGPLTLLSAQDWVELAALLGKGPKVAPPSLATRRRNPGEGGSVFTGRGMDYVESRAYQAGDDLRSMHWTLMARTGKPHVKLHHEEHAGAWHGLIDLRGSMAFGTRVRTKAQQAARAVQLAAGMQAKQSAQTAITCSLWKDDGLHVRGFGRGVPAVRRLANWLMVETLLATPAPFARAAPRQSQMQFAAWAKRLGSSNPRPTRIVMAGDWSWFDASAASSLWSLGVAAEVLVLFIRDPAEITLDSMGQAWFEDLATGAVGWLQTDERLRGHYAQAAQQSAAARLHQLEAAGARLVELHTTDDGASMLHALGAALGARVAAGGRTTAARRSGREGEAPKEAWPSRPHAAEIGASRRHS